MLETTSANSKSSKTHWRQKRMLECGNYEARAVPGSEQYGTDKSGNMQIAIDMMVETPGYEGETMTVVLSFAGKAPEYSIKRLRMLGWKGNDLDNLIGIDANRVPVRVYDDTYQGKTHRKMDIQTGGGTFKFQSQIDARQKKAFAAMFRGAAAAIQSS